MVCLDAAARDADAGPRGRLDGVRVVVVDDEDAPRELFRDVLELEGARVTAVASARVALAAIEREQPDVLVSDVMMPGEDGYWLIAAVLALRKAGQRRPRALAITGDPRGHSRDRLLRAGYDVHLSKPVGVDTLCVTVARLAGRY